MKEHILFKISLNGKAIKISKFEQTLHFVSMFVRSKKKREIASQLTKDCVVGDKTITFVGGHDIISVKRTEHQLNLKF